jgi:GR25 family glycosyltransferase involved in LPS biosynthesis
VGVWNGFHVGTEAWSTMKYTIISLDDSRAKTKAAIRSTVELPEVTDIEFVDARDDNVFYEQIKRHPRVVQNVHWTPKRGELGIWMSQINCWKWAADNEDLLVFEDDAEVHPGFTDLFNRYISELPADWDIFSLFVPSNQRQDYGYRVVYDDNGLPRPLVRSTDKPYQFDIGLKSLARTYHGYGCVANLYSVQGAKKMLQLVQQRGVDGPVDCWMYEHAHAGRLNAYAPKPYLPMPADVNLSRQAPTTIHNTPVYVSEDK